MHPTVVQARVADLIANGWSDTAIAGDTGLACTTVHYMREQSARRLRRPRCWRGGRPMRFTPGEYAELLGFYLGDGHVVAAGRTYRLRLSLDARYPRLAADARALLEAVFESNRVSVTHLGTRSTIVLSVYSVHLPCVFPQHGPGVKHERPIALEQWQHDLVATAPWSFIRGLILSDGCAFINRTGAYRYLSYEFCNSSADIRALSMATCDLVGVRYTTTADRVRIYRRASVAELATFVGTKR